MITEPCLTVLMPVYNGTGFFLRESIESILAQNFHAFELIVINDGSTDGSGDIIREYVELDPRVRIIELPCNCGIVAALNRGLQEARTGIIARMDCGDYSFPDRIGLQYRFLLSHPEHVLVGTQVAWTDEHDVVLRETSFPEDDASIRLSLYAMDNVLLHPTVMFRRLPEISYRERSCAEDYDLWLRLSLHGKLHIIDKPLLKVRFNAHGTTYSRKIMQIRTVAAIHAEFRKCVLDGDSGRDYVVPVLGRLDLIQQELFRYCTARALSCSRTKPMLYALFKLLSVACCPSYMLFLITSALRKLTTKHDAVCRKYLQYGR